MSVQRDKSMASMRDCLESIPAAQKRHLESLSDEPRDDAHGEKPGSERKDAEERMSLALMGSEDAEFLMGQRGLGNSQKAEVAWLERMGYDYEEHDVRDLLITTSTSRGVK